MNFHVGAPRFLPPMLTDLGSACLAYDRRGHDILSIRDSWIAERAAFQSIAEDAVENEDTATWLREEDLAASVIVGRNSGEFFGLNMYLAILRRQYWSYSRHLLAVERLKAWYHRPGY